VCGWDRPWENESEKERYGANVLLLLVGNYLEQIEKSQSTCEGARVEWAKCMQKRMKERERESEREEVNAIQRQEEIEDREPRTIDRTYEREGENSHASL
jgi:hypothetical protein